MTVTPPPYISKWSKILDCMPDGQVLAVSDQLGARTPKDVTQSPTWDWRSQLSVDIGLPCSHPCWSGFILSGLPSVLFASLVLKQTVCTEVCTGGCVGEAVPICRTVPSNKPACFVDSRAPALLSLRLVLGHSGKSRALRLIYRAPEEHDSWTQRVLGLAPAVA